MLFRLVLKYIKRHKFLWTLIVVGMTITMLFALFLMAIYTNVRHIYVAKTLGEVDSVYSFNLIKSPDSWIDWKESAELDDGLIRDLIKMDGIETIYTFYTVHVPSSVNIEVFGLWLKTDIQLYAVSDDYFSDRIGKAEWIGASQQLLDVYNVSLWWTSSLYPTLTQELLESVDLEFYFGSSSFFSYPKYATLSERLTLVDTKMPLLWITFPLSRIEAAIEEINQGSLSVYKIVWTFEDRQSFDAFLSKYSWMFAVTYPDQRLDKINSDLKWLRMLLIVMFGFMLVLAVVFIMYVVRSLLQRHEKMFGIFQSLGIHYKKWLQFLLYELGIYFVVAWFISVILFVVFEISVSGTTLLEISYTSLAWWVYLVVGFVFVGVVGILATGMYLKVEDK